MLFERFVSKERNEPPDIDVDFEHQRREEVIQYIYAKYGRERAALAAAVICYRTRGALRDAGRALGFPLAAIERLAGNLAWWDKREELPSAAPRPGSTRPMPGVQRWLAIAKMLIGFPRHLEGDKRKAIAESVEGRGCNARFILPLVAVVRVFRSEIALVGKNAERFHRSLVA
jgi:DNA polymerase III alpha subunit